MKFLIKIIDKKVHKICLGLLFLLVVGCNNFNDLNNIPKDSFSPENIFTSEAGYEAAVVDLYVGAREEIVIGGQNFDYMNLSTDLVQWGRHDSRGFKDYTLLNSQHIAVEGYWSWAYERMIRQSNLILDNLSDSEIPMEQDFQNNISGQAKFFRAWAYNILVNLYGGVPIVDEEIRGAKFDFQRASKEEVLQFIRKDLEEAVEELPEVMNESNGRIYKAAAYHLLSEVYISLGMETGDNSYYDRAIDAASTVINGEVGHYQLMTERFGDLSRPGDVFSDLFWTNQQNRSSGNLEVIWSLQFENFTEGGSTERVGGNHMVRLWQPEYDNIKSPNGFTNITTDSMQRGIGVNSPLNYLKYDIWELDPNDMRNSKYNIRREFYYNNPEDTEYFGKKILTEKDEDGNLVVALEDGTLTNQVLDTLRVYYPWIRKTDGVAFEDNVVDGRSANDFIKIRLAETYLLRAEAYFRSVDLVNAAQDINTVRGRANAIQIDPNDVSIDFILDERARELVIEEPRRRTLQRMGLLYERVMRYNPTSGTTIEPHNELWPIPQSFIDANTEAEIEQNPGY